MTSLSWKRLRRSLGRFRLLPDRRWPRLLGLDRRTIRTVFDVGAFDGDTARLFRRLFPAATVHCFEPSPGEFPRLSRWAARQGGRVTCECCGVGSTPGPTTLFIYPESPWISSMRTGDPGWNAARRDQGLPEPGSVQVPVRRLDDIAAERPIEDGILVKIDVEGRETDVIRGGLAVLGRAEACIVEITLDHRFGEADDHLTIVRLLDERGLSYAGNLTQSPHPDGHVRYVDALFMRRREGAR